MAKRTNRSKGRPSTANGENSQSAPGRVAAKLTGNEVPHVSVLPPPLEIATRLARGSGGRVGGGDGPPPDQFPKGLDDLNQQISRTYDLSVTAAGNLNIPVIGSVSGGVSRRVVVLERAAYRSIEHERVIYQYGYAIRLAITINRVTAETKLTLPFLAASAELGVISGQWLLQVVGLTGRPIAEAILPPKELKVETFVLATQALEKAIAAIYDAHTQFQPELLSTVRPADMVEAEVRLAVARAYALGSIERAWSLERALDELGPASGTVMDTLRDTYREVAGIVNAADRPSDSARALARKFLSNVDVRPR